MTQSSTAPPTGLRQPAVDAAVGAVAVAREVAEVARKQADAILDILPEATRKSYDMRVLAQEIVKLHGGAIEPRYQGRGLSKPLTAAVCRRLVELGHDRAYLTTSTLRIPAVKLYLSFGFEPEILDTEDERKWKSIRKMLVP